MDTDILVTGGGGFIGQALVRQLLEDDVRVTVIGRSQYPQLEELGVRCLQGDIQDKDFVVHAVKGQQAVCHVAAKAGVWGRWDDYYAVNVAGTSNVIDACRENKVGALVYTSTPSVVFDRESLEGVNEEQPYAANPLCHYAATKIMAEKMVLHANSEQLRTTAIRPHLVWGPGDNHLVPRLLERGRNKSLKMVGKGRNRVDITYIDNVVHAHILAVRNLLHGGEAAGEAFFIGQAESVVLWDWVNDLFKRVGIPVISRQVPFAVAYTAGAMLEGLYTLLQLKGEPQMTRFVAHQLARSHWFSHEKAERVLGYRQQVSTGEGMERLIAWITGNS